MTRETKIGLLVGLAFIIVIGILLSEHLTTSTETPSAALAMAGGNVRQGVVAPGVRQVMPPAPIDTPAAGPVVPIPTRGDLTPGTAEVAIGGPAAPPAADGSPIVISPAAPDNRAVLVRPPLGNDVVVTRPPAVPGSIEDIANRAGEPLVPVNNGPNSTNPTNTRQYKAQPGDTLVRIASLLSGGNTKANRDAIVKLNPTLQKDPNKIIAGRTYLLPLDGKTPAPALVDAKKPADAPKIDNVIAKNDASKPADASYLYTVKAGDSLTKIALEQLGTTTAVAAIKEMNQDVLKGSDVIKIDMKLKLPAKSMAAGN